MISNKCNYALRALLELAKREGEGPMTIVDIAQAQQIPARFLEAILRQLKQAGLTESVRGKKGGYILSRPAGHISLGEVIYLMEGPLFQPTTESAAPADRVDVFQSIWSKAESAVKEVYDAVSFRDLVELDREKNLQTHVDFSI